MSDEEGFLRRWSRRKQAATVPTVEPPVEPPAPAEAASDLVADAPSPEAAADLSALPSIESIGPATDIKGFLQKGVPLDLTRAALRRAWSQDPAIRNFIEVAENQWDFASGTDIPGFGSLDAGTDVGQMVADIMGDLGKCQPDAVSAQALPVDQTTQHLVERAPHQVAELSEQPPEMPDATAEESRALEDSSGDAAPRHEAESEAAQVERSPRRHGSALPQ
jgi:hypothetical protein